MQILPDKLNNLCITKRNLLSVAMLTGRLMGVNYQEISNCCRPVLTYWLTDWRHQWLTDCWSCTVRHFAATAFLCCGSSAQWVMGRPVWARGRCRISPPRFLAECCKRQLNQVSLVLLYFRLSAFSDLYWVCLSVFSCTVLFASTSQVIGCEDRLRNDLYCVGWGVKLYSNQTKPNHGIFYMADVNNFLLVN